MRLGAKVPNSGPLPERIGIGMMSAALENAGFDSLWTSDHIVMPRQVESRYPFSADGTVSWNPADPWYDAVVAMTLMAGATRRCEIGVGVLVLPLRHPVEIAKQFASLHALTGRRLAIGVGAGWLAEEFDALNTPFRDRGRRMEEWIAIMRQCWTGAPEAFDGVHYRLPSDVVSEPAADPAPPILVGGMSPRAIRRAADIGDGWFALQRLDAVDSAAIASAGLAEGTRVVLRITESAGRANDVATLIPDLTDAGVTDVVVDIEWTDPDSPRRTIEALR